MYYNKSYMFINRVIILINKVFNAMLEYFSGDPKRIQHFIKVHAFAAAIAEGEGMQTDDRRTLEIAALVHDIGIKVSEVKYNSSAGKYQELEGPAEADKLLTSLGVEKTVIDRVCYLVGHHHTYKDITELDYQILVEADFLVNLYEDNESRESALRVKDKIFKTKTGKRFISTIYGV